MVGQRGGPLHLSYYRPGEVVLLLQPQRPGEFADEEEPTPPVDPQALTSLFQSIHIPLNDTPFQVRRNERPVDRPAVIMRRATGVRFLKTVHLRSWFSEERVGHPTEQENANAIRDVGLAVDRLNRLTANGPHRFGDPNYELVAASPNWLATPFNGF